MFIVMQYGCKRSKLMLEFRLFESYFIRDNRRLKYQTVAYYGLL